MDDPISQILVEPYQRFEKGIIKLSYLVNIFDSFMDYIKVITTSKTISALEVTNKDFLKYAEKTSSLQDAFYL